MKRHLVAIPLAAITVALTGCSQAAALAPVGGGVVTEVRFATIDVLLENRVDIRTAPVCNEGAGGAISCVGETVAGEPITALAPAGSPTRLTVRVASTTLYAGPMWTVLDRASGAGS